jgi:phage capsid family|nr:MAG TPA: Major capsid protein [Caudoviricetes sp.]
MPELNTKATFNPDNVLLSDKKTGNVPEKQGDLVIKQVVDDSLVTKLAKYEEMDSLRKKFTYLAEGPGAYWVSEGEKIQTSKAKWLSVDMEAHKLAVIIPVSNEFLNFTVTDFFNQMKPKIAEAFQATFDKSVLFGGEDSPFPKGLSVLERATTEGNIITQSDSPYSDINDLMALIEDADLEPQAIATTRSYNKDLRGALDERKLPIFNGPRDGVTAEVLGLPIVYGNKKAWDKEKAVAITGDFDNLFYGIPQGIEYKILEEATLSTIVGEDGAPINLAERDMVGLRATMYVAFLTVKPDAFAVLKPKTANPKPEQ